MTNNEAWIEINEIITFREIYGKDATITGEDKYEALRMAQEALEQREEDAISRQEAIDCLTANGLKKFDFILEAREKINALQSVQPKQKTGEWIELNNVVQCLKCGGTTMFISKFCPNCGAKMVKPQESEE